MSVRTDKKSRVTIQYPEGTDIDPRIVTSGILTYSNEPITKIVYNRDGNHRITSSDYYAGSTKKFTINTPRDANGYIEYSERV